MAEINYTPDPGGTVVSVDGGRMGNLHGSGLPDNSLGRNGYTYVDDDTNDFYVKTGGAWVLVTGSGTLADAQVFRSTADPAGSPGVNVAIHFRTDTEEVWFWNGAAWKKIISAGIE